MLSSFDFITKETFTDEQKYIWTFRKDFSMRDWKVMREKHPLERDEQPMLIEK